MDLSNQVPSIDFCRGNAFTFFPFIRGVPGVVAYFSEVPATLRGSALYFDLNNVQVLKEPQGTLFGLSTNGCAILVRPKPPWFSPARSV